MLKKLRDAWGFAIDQFFDEHRYLLLDLDELYPVSQMEMAAKFKNGDNALIDCRFITSKEIDDVLLVSNYMEESDYLDEEEWRAVFGKKLRNKLIRNFGIQEDVASKIGLSRISLNRYCSGKATPSLYNMNKITNYLCSPLSEFYIMPDETTRCVVVRSMDFWDYAVETIRKERPELYEDGVSWYPVGLNEMLIRTRNNDRYLYNIEEHRLDSIYKAKSGKSGMFETIIDTTEYEFIEEEEWRERFANKLNAIMEALGMTKEELAYKSGVSVISLYSYLTSRSTPSLYNATKLARVLNCTLTDFQILQIEL